MFGNAGRPGGFFGDTPSKVRVSVTLSPTATLSRSRWAVRVAGAAGVAVQESRKRRNERNAVGPGTRLSLRPGWEELKGGAGAHRRRRDLRPPLRFRISTRFNITQVKLILAC